MTKKASKKKVAAKKAAKAETAQAEAFFNAVHPVMSGGFTEPMATQYTRLAYRRFKENLE